MDLRDRVALVTGAGRRLGQAFALALAERGMRVAVHYHRSDAGARETVAGIEARGGRAQLVKGDLSDPEVPTRVVAEVEAAFGGLDVLVNSAANMLRTPFGEVTAREWDAIFALNLRAPFLLAQAAHRDLARSRGAIVNIADLSAFETWPGYLPHGISKGAIVQLTRSLARVMAPEVRVNAIAPGTVLLPDDWPQASTEHLTRTTPLERLGSPDDVVSALLYLLEADYVTGETIVVDGGRHVR